MIVHPDISIYKQGFKYSNTDNKRLITNILYNNEVKLCINKSLINFVEKEIEDLEHFQALIKNLYDSDRIVTQESDNNESFDKQYAEIYHKATFPIFIPITIKLIEELPLRKKEYTTVEDTQSEKKNRVVLDLLSNNLSSVSYLDFKHNDEIQDFFQKIYSISSRNIDLIIFNRDLDATYLNFLKGTKIHYYTLIRPRDIKYAADDKREIKKTLGARTNIYFTSNPRLIHERKILLGKILITIDNALQNTVIEEPTWQIQIAYDPILAEEWVKKCNEFRIVRG